MFDIEQLKAKLAEKITDIDSFVSVLKECRTSTYVLDYLPTKNDKGRWVGQFSRYLITESTFPFASLACKQTPWQAITPSRWWMLRESMRVATGQRTTLHEILDYDRVLAAAFDSMFAYISTTDPTKIAFTACIEDGERDKQTVASVGRFGRLSQVGWQFGDDRFRDAESALRAAVSSDLEILTGPAIEEAWQIGPESCMTEGNYRQNGGGYWSRESVGTHPVMVYDAPGWGVAIIRNGDRISQRAVVYADPATGDKSYIRVYGTGPLERRLKRNGYANRIPYGAKLKLIPAAAGERYYVVPYLDGEGGTNNGNGVCIESGWLKIINSETVRKYRNANMYYSSQGSTRGMVELEEPDLQPWTSLFGSVGSAFDAKYPAARLVDGEIVTGYATPDELSRHGLYDCYVPVDGHRKSMRVMAADRMSIDRSVWIRHPSSMTAAGFVVVSAEHADILRDNKCPVRYEFDTLWGRTVDMHPLPDGTLVPDASMVHVITMKDGAITIDLLHDSQLKKGVHKKIRSFNARRAFVTDGVPVVTVHRSTNATKGYKSVAGVHTDITTTATGTVCFVQDVVRQRVGMRVYNFAPSDIRKSSEGFWVPKAVPEHIVAGVKEDITIDYADVRATVAWDLTFRRVTRMYSEYTLCNTHNVPRSAVGQEAVADAFAKLKAALPSIDHPSVKLFVDCLDELFPALFAPPAPPAEPVVTPVNDSILVLAA